MIDIDKLSIDEKIELAETSKDVNILDILAKDKDWYIRCNVAGNSNTPTEILTILAKDKNNSVISFVAKNTPIEILTILSEEAYWIIRSGVAVNYNTPAKILNILAKDEHGSVRYNVVFNPNVTIGILKELINDEQKWVKDQAITRLAELKKLNSFI